MYIHFPRNHELLLSMLKNGYELSEVGERRFKIYIDVSFYSNILHFSKVPQHEINFGLDGSWISFEGQVDLEELKYINELELSGAILCESKSHVHILAKKGFFGNDTMEYYPPDCGEYWVKYALNEALGKFFFETYILPELKDIRLKTIFK